MDARGAHRRPQRARHLPERALHPGPPASLLPGDGLPARHVPGRRGRLRPRAVASVLSGDARGVAHAPARHGPHAAREGEPVAVPGRGVADGLSRDRMTACILFVGAVHEAEPALRALIGAGAPVAAMVTLTGAGAARTSGAVDLGAIAEPAGIPVLRTDDLNAAAEVERVRAIAPDLIVVVGWTRLLGEPLLAIPPRGCVGFHASLLPRGRGRAPVNWAILRGETETGNTMMFLEPGADTGDIIDQRPVAIGPDDTCASVYAKVGEAGADMLRAHLPALLAGRAPRRAQAEAGASGRPHRTPESGLSDWNRSAP